MALPERIPSDESEDDAPKGTPHGSVEFIVVDLETTGTGSRTGDRVTEVAAVRVQGGVIEPVFHSLVNPGQPIPYQITSLTGIDDGMVRDAPSFANIAGNSRRISRAECSWPITRRSTGAFSMPSLAGSRRVCSVRSCRRGCARCNWRGNC